jgi:hypothetical protein
MRSLTVAAVVLICLSATPSFAQSTPFLGKWDITAETATQSYPLWLEVKQEGGQLVGAFQGRTSAMFKLPEIAVEGQELVFSSGQPKPDPGKPMPPKPVYRAKVQGGRLVGRLFLGPDVIDFVGVRPPKWKPANANAVRTYQPDFALFNGKDLGGWTFQFPKAEGGWVVTDGVLTNEKAGNNIVSVRQFQDFSLSMEYKLEKDSNSGLYLRGRYECQILDDAGKPTSLTGHAAIYGRAAPSTNASKPAGEWQTIDVTLVGNRVTVVLNGQKAQDNVEIEGITGGALNSAEGDPGPIMIQGDHTRIWIRKLVVRPIK